MYTQLWPKQTIDIKIRTDYTFTEYGSWTHKTLVERTPSANQLRPIKLAS